MMASPSFVRCLLLLFAWLNKAQSQEDEFYVVGYLPDYRPYTILNATTPVLTDLILFSVTPTAQGTIGDGGLLGKEHYKLARQAQKYKQEQGYGKLRLWLCVGGGGRRSENFSAVATDPELRKKFIRELIELCHEEGLQGVDFDWEAPRSKEDRNAHLVMLWEAAQMLHKEDLLISVAVHVQHFLNAQVYEAIDRINFMAYDLDFQHVAQFDAVVHVTEESFPPHLNAPMEKIILGIPAYARHFRHPALVKTFAELMDESSGEAISRTIWNGYQYDTPDSIQQKVDYAVELGMRGVFFWELGQDKQHPEYGPAGIMLEAAAKAGKKALENLKLENESEL